MDLIKKSFYALVMICSLIGLYFAIIGLMRIHGKSLLFIIIFFGSIVGIFISIIECFNINFQKSIKFYKLIISILSGGILIFACAYILFIISVPLPMKLFSIFGIVFFTLCIIKSIKNK